MSDGEYSQDQRLHKKKRNADSCDHCRKRKIKCDSATRPGNICSSCLAFEIECTHLSASAKRKRGPPKGLPRGQKTIPSIVSSILSTLKPYEPPSDTAAVKKLLANLAEHITGLEQEISNLRTQLQLQQQQMGSITLPKSHSTSNLSFNIKPLQIGPGPPPGSYLEYDTEAIEGLTEHLRRISLETTKDHRHFGGSSSIMLVKSAIDIKNEYFRDDSIRSSVFPIPNNCKRPVFWTIHPWQILPADESPPPFIFPDPDLIDTLVSLYFTHINVYFPILHKPSFLRSIAQNLHHEDYHFGALILAVCALGARFSDDPRVFEDGLGASNATPSAATEQSIGWKWIRQIQPVRRTFTRPPCIYEIQLYQVYVVFMQSTSTAESCWILVSMGVRFAQDVGAHRKKEILKPTLENELWKRAFWMLFVIDIFTSAFLGRPRCINTEDFDVDLPCMCDDEYWENPDEPEHAFQQPPGKPSSASYFICFIKLMDVLGLVMRTIYAIRRPEMWTASGMNGLQWNEKIVAELDSSLNKWVDEIPEHLRWDPNKENTEHFNQSVMLYTTYYWIQTQIHRQFIARPGKDSLLSFPSLAICANASRSICRVTEIQRRRNIGLLALPNITMAIFNSSLILLVNVWRGRQVKAPTSAALEKELADVYQCLNLLSLHEKRWQQSGRFCDILREIISISHPHLDQRLSTKRSRETELDTIDSVTGDSYPVDTSSIGHRDRQMSATAVDTEQSNPGASAQWMGSPLLQGLQSVISPEGADFQSYNNLFSLPTHTHELGSLPIYESSAEWPTHDQWLSSSTQTQPSRLISNLPTPVEFPAQSQPQSSLNSNLNLSNVIPNFAFSSQSLISPNSYSHGLAFEGVGVTSDAIHTSSTSATTSSHYSGTFQIPGQPSRNGMQGGDELTSSTSIIIGEGDDWDSYMASVDEILQGINPRLDDLVGPVKLP